MDDIRDQMDIANEISDAISRPVLGDELDEVTIFSTELNIRLRSLFASELTLYFSYRMNF